MSKNFDQEYKDLMEQEVPDLWNRIEPSLHDKKSAPVETNIDSTAKIVKFPISRIMKYTGVLAACVCLVILIPTFFSGIKNNTQDSSESDMAYDYESEGVSQATEEVLEESTAEAMDESTSESVDTTSDLNSEETAINDEMKDSEAMEEAPMVEDAPVEGTTVFEGIQVYIIAIKQLPEGTYSYQVEIANVDHDIFPEGLEIEIITETQEMKKGKTYTVAIIGANPINQENNVYSLKEIVE